MHILELSKTLMINESHNDYIKPKYGIHTKLLMTDADSLVHEITTDDFYADTMDDIESKFDTSEYPKDHAATASCGFKVGCNKKIIDMMKDETAGKEITEFTGLQALLCS
jgi:hypothetical protein